MGGIYKITSPSGKTYIGQSVDLIGRFKRYNRLNCKSQPRLYNSLIKYGVGNHSFIVLENCNDDKLSERERYWQEYYDVLSKNGLNCMFQKTNHTVGRMSEETKKKVSKSKKGCVAWNKGLKTNKISRHARKIKNTVTGEVFPNIPLASKSISMKSRTLNAMLTGQNPNKTDLIYIN